VYSAAVPRRTRSSKPGKRWACAIALGASLLFPRPSRASSCAPNAALSACYDANSLWLPAGHASFISLPDTRVTGARQLTLGLANEWLRRPVVLHVASPDQDGRDIRVLDFAIDASFSLAFGLLEHLELSATVATRLYQRGAGTGAVASQTAPPLEGSALRNPRLGLGYSLDDALAVRGLGLRLGFDASLPLGDQSEFSGERSVVAMPNASSSLHTGPFRFEASVGARLRQALDYSSVRLGNQGFAALGLALDVLRPGLLSVAVEAFVLPPLGSSQAAEANPSISSESLVPAEWLLSVRSSFQGHGAWTLSAAAGTGIPLSSETRETSAGPRTTHFVGLGTPDLRSLLVLRFSPVGRDPARPAEP
jgi:hypothetical protein